jgi:hypothetical protein
MLAMVATSVAAHAQGSMNTFSPYTLYGLGDIRMQGTAAKAGMGGVNIAAREVMDYVNPASLSALPRNSFHFNFGIEGDFFYLRDGVKKSSYNTFNVRDMVFRMPLGRKLGFGASLSPLSSVGYRIKESVPAEELDPRLYEMGAAGADYLYKGSGDVSQVRFSLGWEPAKRLSLGVDMIYYFGRIERNYSSHIFSRDPEFDIPSADIAQLDEVSRLRWGVGVQYNIIEQSGATAQSYRVLTVGATYLPELALKARSSITASNATQTPQPLYYSIAGDYRLPATYTAGVFYRTWRLGAGIDYERSNWADANRSTTEMQYRNTNTFRAGAEFTPSRHDVRSVFKRITYRAGVHHSNHYMSFGLGEITDTAVTVGLGIPMRTDKESYLDLGMEYGSRGAKNMIREDYFRVSIGFRLSGEGWFQKRMYQ